MKFKVMGVTAGRKDSNCEILLKEALLANATIIAVCHNHPSGSLRPSQADNSLTTSIQQACNLMRIKFMDHVIITDGSYYSYKEEGIF